jgi:PAS domain S-box-containing protein
MKPFRDYPIQQKLLVMTLTICSAVLLVAIVALFVFQVINFRSSFQRDTATLSAIIANNTTAPLTFKDSVAATEVVESLKAKPNVIAATLVLPDGKLFARFGMPEDSTTLAQYPVAGEFRLIGGHLLYSQPVVLAHEQLGMLHMRLDFWHTLLELLKFYGLVILGVTIVSIGLAAILSNRLRGVIVNPVLRLAETARVVGENKDYSVRVEVTSHGDELGRLTESFNEMLSRIQSQDAALSRSQQKMEALIHSIDGIVWECAADTLHFTFVSPQVERLLGYKPGKWLEEADFWRSKLHPDDRARVIESWHDNLIRRRPFNSEYRMIAADGREVWIRESALVLVEDDKPTVIRGIFQDITEQKKAAEEVEKLNRKLLETSRYAGMAEVATGVLHNVGNVLNSVTVSATLVNDRLRRSKVANLGKAATLLRQQNGHLVEFLTTDPKGRMLPDYLATVAEQVAGEHTELISEMSAVGQHIEHIKEIVAMQQSYAKVSGAYEDLSPSGLVEDALRMNAAAFDRHRIQVVREYGERLPKVCVDRHKVLQILINLVRNAKYAMDNDELAEKKLFIRVESASEDMVAIRVRDTGMGIAPENLVKIFNHGFTTKKDGHGFGLHSGANAAKAMGGRLSAQSEGLGHGAEFILELRTAAAARRDETPALKETP